MDSQCNYEELKAKVALLSLARKAFGWEVGEDDRDLMVA